MSQDNHENFSLRSDAGEAGSMETDAGKFTQQYYQKFESNTRLVVCHGEGKDFLTFEFPATEEATIVADEDSQTPEWVKRMQPADPNVFAKREYFIVFTPFGVFQVAEDPANHHSKSDIERIPKLTGYDADRLVDACADVREKSFTRGKFTPGEIQQVFSDITVYTLSYRIRMLNPKENPDDAKLLREMRRANEILPENLYSDVNLDNL